MRLFKLIRENLPNYEGFQVKDLTQHSFGVVRVVKPYIPTKVSLRYVLILRGSKIFKRIHLISSCIRTL